MAVLILLFLWLASSAVPALGQSEYQEFYYFDQGTQSSSATGPVQFNSVGAEPSYLIIKYDPSVIQYNSFWIQGTSRWSQYMQCPYNARFKLLAYTKGGSATVVEVYPSGYQMVKTYQFYPGYTQLFFWADTIGTHTLYFYMNDGQGQSGMSQSGMGQSQSGMSQSGPGQSQSGMSQSGPGQSQSGMSQSGPGQSQSGMSQSGPGQSQGSLGQSGTTQSGLGQGQSSMSQSGMGQSGTSGLQMSNSVVVEVVSSSQGGSGQGQSGPGQGQSGMGQSIIIETSSGRGGYDDGYGPGILIDSSEDGFDPYYGGSGIL